MNLTELGQSIRRAKAAGDQQAVVRLMQQSRELPAKQAKAAAEASSKAGYPVYTQATRESYDRAIAEIRDLRAEVKRLKSQVGRKGEQIRGLEADLRVARNGTS